MNTGDVFPHNEITRVAIKDELLAVILRGGWWCRGAAKGGDALKIKLMAPPE